MRPQFRLLGGLVIVVLIWAPAVAQRGTRDGQWRSYDGDIGSTKYAPLDQINKSNVANLRIVWRRPAVDPAVGDREVPAEYVALAFP